MSILFFNKESIYQYKESVSQKSGLWTYSKVIYHPGMRTISGFDGGKADLNGARFRFVTSDKGCSFYRYIFEILEDRGSFHAGDHLLLCHKNFVACSISERVNN